ncbi:hypothetical protein I100019A1_22820 [Phocaeicola vulgatus]
MLTQFTYNDYIMKLYKSRTSQKVFSVEISETGFVTLRTPDGRIYNNTGSVIGSMGMEIFLSKCFDYNGTIGDYIRQQIALKEKQKVAQFAAEIKRMEVQEKEFAAMIESHELIPYTHKNVRILMEYLTRTNWGFWELPKMEVGYTASQYETENGRTFVNVKFDSGLKVSNAPTTYLHKGYVPLRSLDENLKP